MISFTVEGIPRPGGSKTRTQYGGLRDSSKMVYPWKRDVVQAARLEMRHRPPLEGPLVLTLEFWMPRPKAHFGAKGLKPTSPLVPDYRPDVLKLARPVEDALSGVCYADDAQIVEEHLYKVYGNPRVVITIAPWEPE